MLSFTIIPQMWNLVVVSKAWSDSSCLREGQGTDVPGDCPFMHGVQTCLSDLRKILDVN